MKRLKAISQNIADHKLDAVVVFIVLGILTILYFNLATVTSLRRQITQQQQIINQTSNITKQLQSNSAQRTQQIQTLTDHIDCIVTLFGQPNRQELKISDIQNCKITTAYDWPVSTNKVSTPTPEKMQKTTPKVSKPPATSTPATIPEACGLKILFICL